MVYLLFVLPPQIEQDRTKHSFTPARRHARAFHKHPCAAVCVSCSWGSPSVEQQLACNAHSFPCSSNMISSEVLPARYSFPRPTHMHSFPSCVHFHPSTSYGGARRLEGTTSLSIVPPHTQHVWYHSLDSTGTPAPRHLHRSPLFFYYTQVLIVQREKSDPTPPI